MTERGLPIADGAPACPFVAFEDDRDERASHPDHRHRCYAEIRPAPRALAHQEAYCLSSAFPVCPTFQDWARREAARSRPPSRAPIDEPVTDNDQAPDTAETASPAVGAASPSEEEAEEDPWAAAGPAYPSSLDQPRRNPPRDWAAPPPWTGGVGAAAASEAAADAQPPEFLASRQPGQGLAGSSADRMAGGAPPPSRQPAPTWDAEPDEAHDDDGAAAPPPPRRRSRSYEQHLGGPDWEPPRRSEAYPTIRSRVGLPNMPRLGIAVLALALAAGALFFLPSFLGVGSGDGANATPPPSVAPSASVAPTSPPAPTATVYVVKSGDTLSKIATAHGLTVEQIMTANPQIKNADQIAIGDQIVIPTPAPDQIGESPAPSGVVGP
jgi:hypothetical protein